ncbi:MAG: hypothetical protein JNK05_00830 [Myxococcales bacterium]|nr:hypothetical protein [Myxococcales bacterium]
MKHLLRASLLVATVASISIAPRAAQAQTVVKPEFLLIVDSSGSMRAVAGANSCGYDTSRISNAACVIRNLSDAFGDGIWGMATYGLDCFATTPYLRPGVGNGCGTTNCIYSFPATLGAAPAGAANFPFPWYGCDDGGRVWVRPQESLQPFLRSWGDNSFTGCTVTPPPGGVGGPEFRYSSNVNWDESANTRYTPLAGSLKHIGNYLRNLQAPGQRSPYLDFNGTGARDPFARCRPMNVILLTDGEECCRDGCALSSTPIGAAANARNLGCLRVDLNNDGDTIDPGEFNQDLNGDRDCYDVVGGVSEQSSFRTRTYVIAFGLTDLTNVNQIAAAGGTGTAFNASNEATISSALADIVSRSQLVELCNGVDDDCDGLIDEDFNIGGACTVTNMACSSPGVFACHPTDQTQAICNAPPITVGAEMTQAQCTDGRDNDCDGATDCADPQCATQSFCSSCTPTAEVCDGRDNDCDGQIDEGMITRPCGSTIGVCRAGTETCVQQSTPQPMGTWGACTGVTGSPEVCDGLDNDCNGVADEGLTRACGVNRGQCRPGVQLCLGASGFGGACIGEVGPSTEVCDGVDNNCDGTVDNGIPSAGSCGVAGVGICTGGTIQCMGGMLQCVGGTTARPETCNNLDDDCNGVVDDGLPAGTTCQPSGMMIPVDGMGRPIGACRLGTQICRGGMQVCDGAVGPSMEVCNGQDDDCDGMVDEGLDGATCGTMLGVCRQGMRRCVMGREVCDGAVLPSEEVCDGLDNDCDGEVDEGNPGGGGACGTMAGSCMSGVNVCRGGRIVCDGARGPMPEVCDGLDNDCNGMIDDGLMDGAPCGSSTGRCMPGRQRCVMGRMVCEGGVGPRAEECNCVDDDCDGMTDEAGEGGAALCGGGSVCAGAPSCGCLRPCGSGEFPCPPGRACQDVMGQRLCVGDPCAGVNCPMGQVCSNGACRSLCDGVTCEAPLVCDPRNGRCVSNDCRMLNNCASNELCIAGRCVMDRCATTTCPAMQACVDGTCVPSCAMVTCPMGQSCNQTTGMCAPSMTDPCASVRCAANQVCNPATGMCVLSMCGPQTTCPRGQACNPVTGACSDDSCATVRCPTGQTCSAGTCREAPRPPVMTIPADRVISSGGGCTVARAPSHSNNGGSIVAALAAAAVLVGARRARKRRSLRGDAEVSR